MNAPRQNLLGLDRSSLIIFLETLGEKPYRAQQILQWIHQRGVSSISEMTNLSLALREQLQQVACITFPEIVFDQQSADGTRKWLLRLEDGNCVETVFIPERNRGTLCVSSQVGCALNCSFCSTGKQGFSRNLRIDEIIAQVWIAVHFVSKHIEFFSSRVTNVVMMGMGEPLLNFEAVVPAMNLMMDDFAYGFSKRRVTLSTSGIVPMLKKLSQVSDVALAISLHAPNDELRNELVPINKKYPLRELLEACRHYFSQDSRRQITMEYVLLDGINDQLHHAQQLIQILQGISVKVNLIPFNPFPRTTYRRSPQHQIERFRDYLLKAGLNTIVRKTRGQDIDAACGQLVGRVQDKTHRSRQWSIAIKQELAEQSDVNTG